MPADRWDGKTDYRPGGRGEEQQPVGGALEEYDRFDPLFFNISPRKPRAWIRSNVCSCKPAGTHRGCRILCAVLSGSNAAFLLAVPTGNIISCRGRIS